MIGNILVWQCSIQLASVVDGEDICVVPERREERQVCLKALHLGFNVRLVCDRNLEQKTWEQVCVSLLSRCRPRFEPR